MWQNFSKLNLLFTDHEVLKDIKKKVLEDIKIQIDKNPGGELHTLLSLQIPHYPIATFTLRIFS